MNKITKKNSAKYTKVRFGGMYLAIAFVISSLFGLFTQGLNLGIDFTGGFITEFSTSEFVNQDDMQELLEDRIDGKFVLSSADENTHWLVREADVESGQTSKTWLTELKDSPSLQLQKIAIEALDSDYIGTQIGAELINQGGLAMLTALIVIMLYLSARFEWRFAVGAILALFHDVTIVLGVFAWSQLEFNLTVLASILAIIGYSLNDSIIVADRIRELMKMNDKTPLNQLINAAIASTLTRTLITSGTTIATISAVWWLAGAPLEGFSIALFVGIMIGTYSSICISATFPEIIGLDIEHYSNPINEEEIMTRH